MANSYPQAEPVEGRAHGFHLAAHDDLGGLGEMGAKTAQDLVDIGRHATQVAAVIIGIDIEDGLYVIVADDGAGGGAAQGGNTAQNGGGRVGGRRDGRPLQGVEGVDAVLRSLDLERITDAIEGVQPFVDGDLSVPAERNERAVGHIALQQTGVIRLRAVHIHLNCGRVHLLVDEYIHGAGNRRHLIADLAGQRVILRRVHAHNLDVDRHGQSEIQDLRGDVGGLKVEGLLGERAAQPVAQEPFVFLGAAGLLQRYQDVPVGVGDIRGGAEGQVDAAGRKADVIENGIQLLRRE